MKLRFERFPISICFRDLQHGFHIRTENHNNKNNNNNSSNNKNTLHSWSNTFLFNLNISSVTKSALDLCFDNCPEKKERLSAKLSPPIKAQKCGCCSSSCCKKEQLCCDNISVGLKFYEVTRTAVDHERSVKSLKAWQKIIECFFWKFQWRYNQIVHNQYPNIVMNVIQGYSLHLSDTLW